MITVYDKSELNFAHNGLTILTSTIRAEVEEELNGIFKLELEYPIDSTGKWKHLNEGNVVRVKTPRGYQIFRIYKKIKMLSSITVYAMHIFYDLLDNFIEDSRPTNSTGASAVEKILNDTQYKHNFKGASNITSVNTAYFIRKNPVEALLSDDDNSFINRWGGEILRDNFSIRIDDKIGKDVGYNVRYKKNLLGFEEDKDESNVATRIMPTGLYENDTVLFLPEKYIDSPHINDYIHPKIQHIHFTELKVNVDGEGEKVTEEDVREALRKKVNDLYEINKVDLPKINFKVDFVELSKTKEYEDFKLLETVNLGDIVTVIYDDLNINLKSEVIKYTYNCISEMYENIELGEFRDNVTNLITDSQKATDDIKKAIIETAQIIEENKNSMESIINEVSEKMNNALGGYVLKRNNELLIMDNPDPEEAVKVWKWNINGLAYSDTGYWGTFSTAITMDGKIVGKFLQGETIRGVRLQGVEIITMDNPNWSGWDITDTSNNVSRFTKGSLEFQNRPSTNTPWWEDQATMVKIDGWGISIDQRNLKEFMRPKYGGRTTIYRAGMISADVDHENENQAFIINGFKGMFFDTRFFSVRAESPIYLEHNFPSTERLGKITKIDGSGTLGDSIIHSRPTDYTKIDLLNGWSNYEEITCWCMKPDGFIQLQGRVKGGKLVTVIGKIPILGGFVGTSSSTKPTRLIFPIITSSGMGRVDIDRAGNIIFMNGDSSGWVNLSNISFRVNIPIEHLEE